MPVPKPKLDPHVEAFYNQLLEKAGIKDGDPLMDSLHTILSNESVATEFKSGIYGRKLTDQERTKIAEEKQRQEQDYQRKLTELESLQRTLASTSSLETKKIAQLEQAKVELIQALSTREQQLQRLHNHIKQYNNGEEVLREIGMPTLDFSNSTPPPPTREPITKPEPKTEPPITKDALLKEVQDLFGSQAQVLGRLPFDLMKFSREYKSLTGKDFDESEFYDRVRKEAELNQGRVDYHQVYIRDYDIENLREKQKRDLMRTEIRRELEDEYEQKLSKQLTPSPTGRPADSVFYNSISSTIPESEKQNQVSGSGLNDRISIIGEAVADFNKQHKAA